MGEVLRPLPDGIIVHRVLALAASGSVDELRQVLGSLEDDSQRTSAANARDGSDRSALAIASASNSKPMVSLVRQIELITKTGQVGDKET